MGKDVSPITNSSEHKNVLLNVDLIVVIKIMKESI